jgi:hypothetical protein
MHDPKITERNCTMAQIPQQRKRSAPGSSSNPYLVTAVKIMFVLLILLLQAKLVVCGGGSSRQRHERQYNIMKTACERGQCAEWLPEENMNCVHQCIDRDCYTEVYGDNPLEDGEIDVFRTRSFITCLKAVLRRERAKSRQGARVERQQPATDGVLKTE